MCVCVLLCTTVIHNTAQHRTVLIILHRSTRVQMLSIGGEGTVLQCFHKHVFPQNFPRYKRTDVLQDGLINIPRPTQPGHPSVGRCNTDDGHR